MRRNLLLILAVLLPVAIFSQNHRSADMFWNSLLTHCGYAYEGEITEGGKEGDGFTGNRLIMKVIRCGDDQIKIPFFAGDDRSRTWVLTRKDNHIELKHEHRHEDGSDDSITLYGGTSPHSGLDSMQIFPADQYTCDMISYACGNVWWMTINEHSFTYNLRRIGSDRLFTVTFDLSRPFTYPEVPWGWKE